MERTYKGITYELVKQPTPKRRDAMHRVSTTCCDGCEIPSGECQELSHNECTKPENLDSVWKKSVNQSISNSVNNGN